MDWKWVIAGGIEVEDGQRWIINRVGESEYR